MVYSRYSPDEIRERRFAKGFCFSMMQATAFEYRHRYLVHGLVYTLGLAAPWHPPIWSFLQNQSILFVAANELAKPEYQNFAMYWNCMVALATLFAVLGAWLRIWGAAYLGATTVHQGGMEGGSIITNGPYRYTRNPLYLGTIFNTLALSTLMRPEAALLTFSLIVLVQYRLIGREETYLAQQLGPAYERYAGAVPRLLPSLRAQAAPSGAVAQWKQGILSEVYPIGTAVAFATVGWATGYSWESSLVHVLQGVVIGLGLSVAARAFIPKAQF